MSVETRRLSVLDGDRRVDLVAPGSMVLGEVLDSAGIRRQRGYLQAVDGSVAVLRAPVADLADGALLTVVSPAAAVVPGPEGRARAPRRVVGPWWALAAVGLVALSVALSQGVLAVGPVAAVLGGVAVVGTAAAVRCGPAGGAVGAARVAAPAVVAVAAVVVAVPRDEVGGTQLVVLTAALAVVTLSVLAAAADRAGQSRAGLAVVAVMGGVLAAWWGLVLALGWGVQTGAAVVVGAVPLGLRALPGALLAVPDGWLIDVERYQDTRWSVRSTVRSTMDTVDAASVRARVGDAAGARVVGTVVLSTVGAAALPFAVSVAPASVVVRSGQVGLLVCYAAATTLLARSAGRHLHWVPRASAVVAVVVGLWSAGLVGATLTGAVLGALAAGLGAAAVVVLVGRGGRSLVLSRAGDVVETVTLALCLPAGLLAGGVVDAVGTLVA